MDATTNQRIKDARISALRAEVAVIALVNELVRSKLLTEDAKKKIWDAMDNANSEPIAGTGIHPYRG
ncbi:MAG: hypothetical protein DI568_17020 [Sphingomonas sp.]|nr:MAG: hypothetical protein DI568_17020 [Sphingomonas sp.]